MSPTRASPPETPLADALEPLRSPRWLTEARRKAIHIACLILPLGLLHEWLPWPRGKPEWRWFLIALTLLAMAIDLVRIHDRRDHGCCGAAS